MSAPEMHRHDNEERHQHEGGGSNEVRILPIASEALSDIVAGDGRVSASTGDTVIIACPDGHTGTGEFRHALDELDAIIANLETEIGGVLVLSFLSREQAVQERFSRNVIGYEDVAYGQLPMELSCVHSRASTTLAKAIQRKPWQTCLLRLDASTRLAAVANRGYRHEYRNLIAAVRIFIGALQARAIDLDTEAGRNIALLVLRALQDNEKSMGGTSSTTDPETLLKIIRNHQRILKQCNEHASRSRDTHDAMEASSLWRRYRQIGTQHADRDATNTASGLVHPLWASKQRILMLDDLAESHGWADVLGALHPDANGLKTTTNWEDASEALQSGCHWDLMLLDCDLGKDMPTGLERLKSIRDFMVDLPIVMMTAADHSELALWALRSGASGFFVKELNDSADRDSLDYYLKLCTTVRRPAWEEKLRSGYKHLQSALDNDAECVADVAYLLEAYYLLFSLADGTTWWSHWAVPFSEDSGEEEISEWVGTSVGVLVKATFDGHPGGRAEAAAHVHGVSLTPAQAAKELVGATKKAFPAYAEVPRELSDVAAWPSDCRISQYLMGLSCDPLGRERGRQTSGGFGHLERSQRGAIQFLLGRLPTHQAVDVSDQVAQAESDGFHQQLAVIPSVAPPSLGLEDRSVILIDDEGDSNGWNRALSATLGGALSWYPSLRAVLDDKGAIGRARVILLDLWLTDGTGMPSPSIGLDVLRRLKRGDPWLPVIVLSAATDTVNAIRCLRLGATDYCPKWVSGEDDPSTWQQFAGALIDRVQACYSIGGTSVRDQWMGLRFQSSGGQGNLSPYEKWLSRVVDGRIPSSSAGVRQAYLEYLLPAMVLYQQHLLSQTGLPLIDQWRVDRLLAQGRTAADAAIVAAGRAVEYLGWLRCCFEGDSVVSLNNWRNLSRQKQTGRIVERASSIAYEVWRARNGVLHKREHVVNPEDLLIKALQALSDFEGRSERYLSK